MNVRCSGRINTTETDEKSKVMKDEDHLIRLDPEKLAGLGLNELAPYPDEVVLSGTSKHRRWEFSHDEIFVGAYEAEPVELALKDYPHDEFMFLLSGKILITDEDGHLEEFFPGQALVLKKGFTGTFEMQGNVRKIAIINGDRYSPL